MKKHIYLSEDQHFISEETSQKIMRHLLLEIARVKDAIGTQYTTRYASINAPSDVRIMKEVKTLATKLEDMLAISTVILIGIGGSSLGALAILEALYGKDLHKKIGKRFYCAENIDADEINNLQIIVRDTLNRGEDIILIVVSKSGSTIETISNAAIFIQILKEYNPESYNRSVVIITDHGSELWYIAQANHWSVLEIPSLVGGRFSVFTAAGLFPLALMGVDIDKIAEGAHTMRELCVSNMLDDNIAARSAIFLYTNYQNDIRIHDTFLFSSQLWQCGQWYRQLLAESIGKLNSNDIPIGITPTISVGSTDLHSMAQLYLGGPCDRCTTFIWVNQKAQDIPIPRSPLTEKTREEFLATKSLNEVMSAIFSSTIKAYREGSRPFTIINLSIVDEKTIGAFMQMKMLEVIYLGYLFEVNPFDQPNVESYKKTTRELLST